MSDNLPAPQQPNPRALVESLGEEALVDFLGVDSERKPYVRFTPERQVLYLRYLIRCGRRGEAALVAGVSYETMRRLRSVDKQFARAEEAALELHNDMVRALILDRAENGQVEETWEAMMVHQAKTLKSGGGLSKEMVLTKRVRKMSDAMLLAYAKSRMPEFREKGDIIANNASGGVLVVNAPGSSSESWEEKFGAPVDAEHEVIDESSGAADQGDDGAVAGEDAGEQAPDA